MRNQERIAALNMARREALENAKVAQGAVDGEWGDFTEEYIARHARLASMWATVAEAMKVGPALEADGVEEPLINGIGHTLTRQEFT